MAAGLAAGWTGATPDPAIPVVVRAVGDCGIVPVAIFAGNTGVANITAITSICALRLRTTASLATESEQHAATAIA